MTHPLATALAVAMLAAPVMAQEDIAAAFPVEALPDGYVRGDVVSYSYVPNRHWGRAEACGVLPYLVEYGLMKFQGDDPLENFHEENVRRIDLASQWSTCIMLYAREAFFRDEIINLMIRAFTHRQLIILRDYFDPQTEEPLANTLAILDRYDPYAIPEARALLEGGTGALVALARERGVGPDPEGYYSVCDLCRSMRGGMQAQQGP